MLTTRQILRAYQTAAIDGIRERFRVFKRVLCCSPVGSGKTTIFAETVRITANAGHPVLVLAHRKELIDQASARLDGFGIPHGVIMASHPRRVPHALVQVASIQTLHNRPKPTARLVVVDEAHRAKADTWMKTLSHYPESFVAGFTATPWRLDGKGLGDLFQSMVVATTPRELVGLGYLCPVTGFSYDVPDLKDVKTGRNGDYQEGQLTTVMSKPKIIGNIIEKWKERASDLSTVVFASSVEHSKMLAEQFRAAGVTAEHLDGTVPKLEREAILARVASGETQVICNVNVLTEGTDIPRLKCCILARPTKSLSLYIQMVGRVCRVFEGLIARVHDHSGCVAAHGLPYADREYSLDTTPPKRAPLDGLRTCKACYAIYDPKEFDACPSCGFQNPALAGRTGPEFLNDGKLIEFDELEFKEVKLASDDPIKKAFWLKLIGQAQQRGYKPGWAHMRFLEKHGHPPHWSWSNPSTEVDFDFFKDV